MNRLYQAGAWLVDYIYAGWRQLHGHFSRDKPRDFLGGSRTPILVIPGVYEHWHFMLPLIHELHRSGHPVHVVEALSNNRASVSIGAEAAAAYLAEHDLHNVIIVAHSKGGLVGKHVMSFGRSSHRVRQMIAIATPFAGSRYARLFRGRTLRSFSPNDETLLLLTGAPGTNARITSIYARFDPHIPEGSELEGARNVQIDAAGHFRILKHPATRAEIVRVVSE